MNAHLETYLNDHLAGSDSALDLLTRLEEKYANMTLDLAEVRAEVQEDQKELKTIMARLNSPYRFIINPIVDYVLDLEEKNHDREVAVLVPELVEERWYLLFAPQSARRMAESFAFAKRKPADHCDRRSLVFKFMS
jgi:hypothetical protein